MMHHDAAVVVLGSLNADIVLSVARLPAPGETVAARGVADHLGGKGANQAVAAARGGAKVVMIGAVGEDAAGARLIECLTGEGVDCGCVTVVAGQPTGTAHILVDDAGENQIAVVGGANAAVSVPSVDARVRLTQLESPIDAVAAFLEQRPPGTLGILNAAPFTATARPLFGLADIIVFNETELAAYAGVPVLTTSADVAASARVLLARAGQTIIVTLGKAGSLAVDHATAELLPAPAATVVDTTGAGDCFCGYLAARLAAGDSLAEARMLAHRAAALAVTRRGAIAAIPFAAELGG